MNGLSKSVLFFAFIREYVRDEHKFIPELFLQCIYAARGPYKTNLITLFANSTQNVSDHRNDPEKLELIAEIVKLHLLRIN